MESALAELGTLRSEMAALQAAVAVLKGMKGLDFMACKDHAALAKHLLQPSPMSYKVCAASCCPFAQQHATVYKAVLMASAICIQA